MRTLTPIYGLWRGTGRRRGARVLAALLLGLALVPAGHALPIRATFDHLTTGFELIGQHRDLPCESCHANAIFKGTPTDCGACHGIGTAVRATAKPANHIMSTDQCAACHTPVAWNPAVNFDHTQARGSCSTCHNNVQAQGKGPTHIVTDLECDACHTTLTWAGAVFTHQGITDKCASCHDGKAATGMPLTHIPVSATPCEGCHSTTNFVTFAGTKINHLAVTALTCKSCHEAANYLGMHPSTNTVAADSRPNATLDKNHPPSGDCGQCHDTVTFAGSAVKPPNHIPTSPPAFTGTPPCSQCHTTAGQYALYSVTGVHQGAAQCAACHGSTVNTSFHNVTIVTNPGNHIPFGTLDCSGSGCHSTKDVNAGGFKIGAASLTSPTLSVAGHATVAAAVSGCTTCHESAALLGMIPSSAAAWGDSRPQAFDAKHPATGECSGCHTTSPTFAKNLTAGSLPAKHIPIVPPTYAAQPACATCHTGADSTTYSVTATHQGVTRCLTCHGPTVNTTFDNVTMVTVPANHMPIGSLDCNGSGCHTTKNVNAGGFKIGVASLASPTLNVAGHATVAAAVSGCASCHETAPYVGMIASSGSAGGDSRPTAFDAKHPTSGDCGTCHTTTPTFATDLTQGSKPANHIPTTAACAQCHTTAGNYALYSSPGTHQGVTGCLTCHGPTVNTTFDNVTMVTTVANHIPIGALDCNASGCHTTGNVTPGGNGFKIGAASISAPTLNVAGHTSVSGVAACATCHESASYVGMLASTNTAAGDSRPNGTLDSKHPATGDCGNCHVTTPTFVTNLLPTAPKPANHIPTTAVCAQCHTTAGNFALYSVTGTHQGVTTCNNCHGPAVATTFINVTIVSTSASHIPIGTADCNGSGCHNDKNVNPGGFKIGNASVAAPTLTVAGHTTVAGAGVAGCQTCHESAPYQGMLASTASAWGDSRPTAFDKAHPTSGDCNGCHTTTPTFNTNQTNGSLPANHIPITPPTYGAQPACATCHTTAGNYAAYSVAATHQGVTTCLACHGATLSFANITTLGKPANHMPIGALNCNGSGCHTTGNVNPGGFKIGNASVSTPTLTVAGHTTVKAATPACQTCHETAPYVGMIASTASAWGDSRPTAFDKAHPTTGDCSGCHTTTPTFFTNQSNGSLPANHIPIAPPTYAAQPACATCHTTAGNYAAYSVAATHKGVTTCLACHGATLSFANITTVGKPGNHMPIGALNCNGSGCHTTGNVNPGGFKIGAANLSAPTLTVAGHTTVKTATPACQTCHETAPYVGMIASTASAAGDSRPQAFDKSHPATGDCSGCHTTTPTFTTNQSGSSAKPANHIPTNAACAQCHTTAGNYGAYVMGPTGHTGITTNCAQCHAYGLSFYNMAPPTLKEPPSGATGHIPSVAPNGTAKIACELCHTSTGFTSFSGTVMKHAYVTSMTCMSCHEHGMTWKTNGNLWTRPNGHHTGQDCGGSGCHSSRDKLALRPAARNAPTATGGTANSTASRLTARGAAGPALRPGTATTAPAITPATAAGPFNHASVAGTACVSCHSAASGAGKPAGHISTTDRCQSCHTTLGWLPLAMVDHTQVIGSCVSCHNGKLATGKPSSHLPTSAACESCHTTNAWTPARFDHAAVAPHTCATCHNSVRAIGKPRTHIPTSQQCDACHGTLAWKPVRIDHTGLTSACASCHNNGGAVGIPPGHMTTRLDCSTCHSYPDWSAMHFRHASAAYPGTHRKAFSCTSCHTSNTDQVPWPSPAQAGTCAGCHAKDFKPAAHPKTIKGLNYTVSELANCSGACHVYSDTTQSTITKKQPGPYHRVSDGAFKR